jgi:hypothetical protein
MILHCSYYFVYIHFYWCDIFHCYKLVMYKDYVFLINSTIQDVPGGKVNIQGGHSIGHSKQTSLYVHVTYSKRFPR